MSMSRTMVTTCENAQCLLMLLDILLQKIRINTCKELLRTAYVGFCKRAATNHIVHSEVSELVSLRLHAYLKFAKRIKVFEYAEQHYHKMLVAVKTLHVSLASFRFATYLKNFLLVE